MKPLSELKGLGPKSIKVLNQLGITEAEQLLHADAFELYGKLKQIDPSTSLNFLYAIIGAQQNKHWQSIAHTRKEEILMRLDDLGLAPK